MADSFAGTTIQVRNTSPMREQGADISIRHVPGGNANYIDIGGLTPRKITYSLFFATDAAYKAFEALVTTQGTLISVPDAPSPGFNVLLLSLKRDSRNLSSAGESIATAEFLVV